MDRPASKGLVPPNAPGYPITPLPADDKRFTYGLVHDLAAVLERHGYPEAGGLRLLETMHRFLYGDGKAG